MAHVKVDGSWTIWYGNHKWEVKQTKQNKTKQTKQTTMEISQEIRMWCRSRINGESWPVTRSDGEIPICILCFLSKVLALCGMVQQLLKTFSICRLWFSSSSDVSVPTTSIFKSPYFLVRPHGLMSKSKSTWFPQHQPFPSVSQNSPVTVRVRLDKSSPRIPRFVSRSLDAALQ